VRQVVEDEPETRQKGRDVWQCGRSEIDERQQLRRARPAALAVMHDHWKHCGKPARLSVASEEFVPDPHHVDTSPQPGGPGRSPASTPPSCGAASLPQLSSWCMLTRVDDADRELRHRFETAYDENGVDRSQIRQRLALSPEERLARVDEAANALRELRAGMEFRDDQLSSDSRSPHTAPR
jgi:hypothetical protein